MSITASIRVTVMASVIMTAIATAGSSCGHQAPADNAPIPRRHAYPRINLYEADYRTASVANVRFLANSGAQIMQIDNIPDRKGEWFNIIYPRYDAVIHCTVTNVPTIEIENIIDNRAERMALNTGGAYTEVIDFTPHPDKRFTAQLLVTPAESVTPVQFIASDGIHTIVSGSMTFRTNSHLEPDSVAPVIGAIRADMIEMLNSLTVK